MFARKIGISLRFCRFLTLNVKIINQKFVLNGSNINNTSDKVWIVQNGIYLTYPKIDCELTWNFSSILSIFYFLMLNYKPKGYNQWLRHYQYKRQGLDRKEWKISHMSQN